MGGIAAAATLAFLATGGPCAHPESTPHAVLDPLNPHRVASEGPLVFFAPTEVDGLPTLQLNRGDGSVVAGSWTRADAGWRRYFPTWQPAAPLHPDEEYWLGPTCEGARGAPSFGFVPAEMGVSMPEPRLSSSLPRLLGEVSADPAFVYCCEDVASSPGPDLEAKNAACAPAAMSRQLHVSVRVELPGGEFLGGRVFGVEHEEGAETIWTHLSPASRVILHGPTCLRPVVIDLATDRRVVGEPLCIGDEFDFAEERLDLSELADQCGGAPLRCPWGEDYDLADCEVWSPSAHEQLVPRGCGLAGHSEEPAPVGVCALLIVPAIRRRRPAAARLRARDGGQRG